MYILAENEYYKWLYKVIDDGLQLVYTNRPNTIHYVLEWDNICGNTFDKFTWHVLTKSEVFLLLL